MLGVICVGCSSRCDLRGLVLLGMICVGCSSQCDSFGVVLSWCGFVWIGRPGVICVSASCAWCDLWGLLVSVCFV